MANVQEVTSGTSGGWNPTITSRPLKTTATALDRENLKSFT
jgi:hypothetical protein